MFKNEYQGGPFVEIFSAQGKNPGAKWKIFGSPSVIWKEFDKEVKSFVFVLEGSSQTNKIQLPKENKQILGLIQRFLVLQIYVPLGQDFSTELLCFNNSIHKLLLRFFYMPRTMPSSGVNKNKNNPVFKYHTFEWVKQHS